MQTEKCLNLELTEKELLALAGLTLLVSVSGREVRLLAGLQEKLEQVILAAGLSMPELKNATPKEARP